MARRPTITVIYISAERIVRADAVKGELLDVHQWERPLEGDLPMLVETAIRGGGKPGGKVWVLTTDVWMQTANLVSGAIAGTLGGGGGVFCPRTFSSTQRPRTTGEVDVPFAVTLSTAAWVRIPP